MAFFKDCYCLLGCYTILPGRKLQHFKRNHNFQRRVSHMGRYGEKYWKNVKVNGDGMCQWETVAVARGGTK
jgi:hypothetical protein